MLAGQPPGRSPWPHNISDDDLLARLLALNLEREAVDALAGEEEHA